MALTGITRLPPHLPGLEPIEESRPPAQVPPKTKGLNICDHFLSAMPVMLRHGISYSVAAILGYLAKHQQATIPEICEKSCLSYQAVTFQLRRHEDLFIIDRGRRPHAVRMTPEGVQIAIDLLSQAYERKG